VTSAGLLLEDLIKRRRRAATIEAETTTTTPMPLDRRRCRDRSCSLGRCTDEPLPLFNKPIASHLFL
jgi:hypothetical protein